MNKNRGLLFRLECKKCFTGLTVGFIFIFLLARCAAAYFEFRESEEDGLYKETVAAYTGAADQAVINEIKEKYGQYTALLSEFPNTQILYAEGKIEREVFMEQLEEYKYINRYINVWEQLNDNALRYEMPEGKSFSFFYENAWEKLLSVSGIDYICVLLFILVLIPYFFLDESVEIYPVISCLAGYKNVRRYRIVIGILFASVCVLLCESIDLAAACVCSDIPEFNACAYSLSEYSGMAPGIPLSAMFAVRLVFRMFESAVMVFALAALQRCVKNKILTMAAMFALLIAGNSFAFKIFIEFL